MGFVHRFHAVKFFKSLYVKVCDCDSTFRQDENRTRTSSMEFFCEISNKYGIVFSLSTGLETTLADVLSACGGKEEHGEGQTTMPVLKISWKKSWLRSFLASVIPVIPPMKQDDFCKSHCNPMHKSTVGM